MDKTDNKAKITDRIKGDKKRILAVAALAAGVLLMLFSSALGKRSETAEPDTLASYKRELEAELSELCSSIEGAGRCDVKISFSEGERIEYRGTSKISETPPRVLGVTVVCKGAERAEVRSAITNCITALFDIGANRVAVVKRS